MVALAEASAQISSAKRILQVTDVVTLKVHNKFQWDHSALTRAYHYVWMAAVLETYIKKELRDLLDQVSSAGVSPADLKIGWLTMSANSIFRSVIDGKKYPDHWESRLELFKHTSAIASTTFDLDCLPLDGRPLRKRHFSLIWSLLEFPQPILPTASHGLALEDLANSRNQVAHGNVEPVTFGKSKTCQDAINIAEKVEDIIMHFSIAKETCLKSKAYLR